MEVTFSNGKKCSLMPRRMPVAITLIANKVRLVGIVHAQVVNDIATQRELPYHIGTPLSELSSTDRVNTITHRNDSVKVIELCHVVLAVRSSCRVFLGN